MTARVPRPGDPRANPPPLAEVPGLLREGAALWNAARYWHAHEAWESAWHALRAAGRAEEADAVQGLILATAALENLRRGKPDGFRRQMAEGLHRLRTGAGRVSGLGLVEEAALVEALTVRYLDAARRTSLSGLADLGGPVPPIAFR